MTTSEETASRGEQPRQFLTTRWSLIVAAGGTTGPSSRAALSELCRLYWYPVYAFVRRSGHSADAAQDLTQGFFSDLLERKDFAAADPARGRFRQWLLGCAKNYLHNERDRVTAKKRTPALALDAKDAEDRYAREPTDGVTPEQLYLRRWTMLLITRVLSAFAEEKTRAGNARRFALLQPYLVDHGHASYAQVAAALETSEDAIKTAVHSLREEFRTRLRAEIAGTVATAEEIEAELHELLSAL